MKRIASVLLVLTCLVFVGSLTAYARKGPGTPYSGSKEYERMKGVVGAWKGLPTWGKRGNQ